MAIEKTGYEEYLRTSQQDFESRWENVKELVSDGSRRPPTEQISYSVIVAEEQARESQTDSLLLDDGFIPASSAAVEAAVELATKRQAEAEDRKVHPMFRRQSSVSSSGSRSASVVPEEKPKKRSRTGVVGSRSTKRVKGVKEEVIELVDSDDDAEEAPAQRNGDLDDKSE